MEQALLQERLNSLPTKPGVYLMKDAAGQVIYVGKAVNLRNRVRSYFHAYNGQTPKIRRLVDHIADFDFIVTGSELEALILECNLIKKYRPRYNVRLKDDKRYPYIKISLQEPFPRIYTVRHMQDDGARYFGPYTSAKAVQQTMELLRKLFPYLTCKREITGKDQRACLYYHIGRCAGPCIGAISREDYRALIEQIVLFLEGKQERIIHDLEQEMQKAAEALDFERAAVLRDQVQALQRVVERQKIVSATRSDEDVIAFAREDGQACVQTFFIRGGKLIGREYFILTGTQDEDDLEVMTSFVKQFYDEAAYIPPTILLQHDIEEAQVIEEWLRQKRGTRVAIRVPRRGKGRALVQMAAENAAETLAHLRAQWAADQARQVTALDELQKYLHLAQAPTRIECYDISNIQGTSATGSMVVFVKGVPRKSEYRRFRIKTVSGADDYAMLQEVLRRRFKRAKSQAVEQKQVSEEEGGWGVMPDLVIVDGGKGQLRAALGVMGEMGVGNIPAIGLAKQREEVFVPGRSDPLLLPRDSEALYLLQRVRDEAHRFAIGYHRRLRERSGLASTLDQIPGVGPKRRQALLKHFGSLEAIREASVEELAAVKGITREAAERIKERL
ncbi:MAG: excinuclease ABC subunit UvrC [Chloroflexi bacterium]|nr:excinuclease ABC subunit UvrC [Chloroflexota bacterium]